MLLSSVSDPLQHKLIFSHKTIYAARCKARTTACRRCAEDVEKMWRRPELEGCSEILGCKELSRAISSTLDRGFCVQYDGSTL
jgi:hypothetical protein